jgi:hypothetical protein
LLQCEKTSAPVFLLFITPIPIKMTKFRTMLYQNKRIVSNLNRQETVGNPGKYCCIRYNKNYFFLDLTRLLRECKDALKKVFLPLTATRIRHIIVLTLPIPMKRSENPPVESVFLPVRPSPVKVPMMNSAGSNRTERADK